MRYLEGVTLDAFARGNRRLITAARTHAGITWRHCAGCAGGAAFFWPVVHGWLPAALTGGATLWTLTALAAGQQTPDPATPGPAGDSDRSDPAPDQFIATLHHLMPDKGRLHLATVAQHLATTKTAVREMCDTAGIPYGPVRVGPTSSTGIKREDLPPLSAPSQNPVVGVVAAGQSNNNNTRVGFYSTPATDHDSVTTRIVWVTDKAS